MVMNMEQEKFLQEGMDGKRFLLCLLKQWNKMAAAAAAGVVFTVAAYLCVMGLQKGETVYESLSNYYVYYNTDEKGNVKDYFNAYTWNDWMKADVMLDYVMPSLPEEISREEVKAAVRAECPSNAGWIYVYAEHTDPEKAERIGEAYVTALSDFAKNELGLSDIECWNREPVHEKKAEYKTVRAGIFGGVCGFLLAFFWLGFYYVMDDSFYLSEDIKKDCRCRFSVFIQQRKMRMKDGTDSFRMCSPTVFRMAAVSEWYVWKTFWTGRQLRSSSGERRQHTEKMKLRMHLRKEQDSFLCWNISLKMHLMHLLMKNCAQRKTLYFF